MAACFVLAAAGCGGDGDDDGENLLEPPQSLGEGYAEWLALRNELTTAMRDLRTAGTFGDEAGVAAGLRRVDTHDRRGRLARRVLADRRDDRLN